MRLLVFDAHGKVPAALLIGKAGSSLPFVSEQASSPGLVWWLSTVGVGPATRLWPSTLSERRRVSDRA